MAKHSLKPRSAYARRCIVLTTKHAKSIAIASPLFDKLKASVLEYVVDTDQLGTFSGEVERSGNALECARKKCEWSLDQLGDNVKYALASEGSFGPHPFIPFLSCDHEILYFIDRKHDFHLHLSHVSEKTNYRKESIDSMEGLLKFAKAAQFPSHALILRPNDRETKTFIFKGVNSQQELEESFEECMKQAANGRIWVETDMRAQFNPSRMAVIKELAENFADRLASHCPACETPGWGKVRAESGMPCKWCKSETKIINHEIFGCAKCSYKETHKPAHGLRYADPENCEFCNP
ncbi:MAG: hypothetical protein Q8S21_00005 [Candidatus Paracaedibacteraceae bacterium]|nr:hypothetical protein [Candidatus Paracaedibacteraceae bacterium]